jgi:hypothetical protein
LFPRTIFETLYALLAFGHEAPESAAALDPPTSFFRVRLVCTLLETCGGYFHRGSAGRKLDRFLAYFQRYLLAKPPLPLDVEFDIQVRSSAADASNMMLLRGQAGMVASDFSKTHHAKGCDSRGMRSTAVLSK